MANSRQQQVIDTIRQMILHGIFPGGHRLIETDLSQRLDISRTPIREALIALAEERLIEYRKNKGYVVRGFELNEILERFTVRSALEGLACRIIAERGMSASLKRRLTACLAEGDAILAKPDINEGDTIFWARMNENFHRAIIEASENETLIQTYEKVTQIPHAPTRIQWLSDQDKRQPFETFHKDHHALVQKLQKTGGAGADALMQAHILASADYMSERFRASLVEPIKGKVTASDKIFVG
ncbi:transcriptional regulator, GntR family [Sphingobium chlorophenolicum L-1]|uniref:Transcriptional regulator, GntR family n=1 Tax=Sphingobium chlorophenolicum L-1 TaxID=690566 RepID=F6F384_SPHCR|nr:GntR family transcriptional regulator [Sphingobium chlorophenolicum]AEG50896.1 transcriptional regulator, GntR family [Sphingobium chlorophenolicum L-1]